MQRPLVLLVVAAALGALLGGSGCALFGWGEQEDPPPLDEATRLERTFGARRALLDPGEQTMFDQLEIDRARERFLELVGVTAELRVRQTLERGMSADAVARRLGLPEDRESEWNGGARYEYWTYRELVSDQVELKSTLQFRDERLIDWEIARDGS